jgi:hypothetical protein
MADSRANRDGSRADRHRAAGAFAHEHGDIVLRLAQDHGIVLLNGSGFDAPDGSVRVSFANLDQAFEAEGQRRRPGAPREEGAAEEEGARQEVHEGHAALQA